ncbi:MAG: UDP-N-acetylglucosamine 1-carboxyvinyltransferase, partial [Bacteroidota bacterium]
MDKLVAHGGRPMVGEIRVSGSKNTALPLMAATLLVDGVSTIERVPVLRDVRTFAQVIRATGAGVTYDRATSQLCIDAATSTTPEAPYDLVKRMRASIYMLGALLARFGRARVSLPGGCAWGPRPVNLHIEGMQALGASIEVEDGYIVAHAPGGRLRGGTFRFEPTSVGATINVLLAATTASSTTELRNCAVEPDVVDFARGLQAMGAQIEGIGTRRMIIEGVDALHAAALHNAPDRIELGTYMIAAALLGTPGRPLRILDADASLLGEMFRNAFDDTGAVVDYASDTVTVDAPDVLQPVSVRTDVYPGFPTDLQAQWTVLMTQASGESTVRDTIYADRFAHVPELRRLGAELEVSGNAVHVKGGQQLKGATVMSTDLRASVS